MTALCGIFCLTLWVPASSYAVLLVFALASGSVTGIFWGTVVPVTAEVVGLQRLPSAFGVVCLPLLLPTLFAEPIALQLASTSGYLTSKVFVGCMFLLGAISTWALRAWVIWEEETRTYEGRTRQTTDSRMYRCKVWLTPRRLFMNKRV